MRAPSLDADGALATATKRSERGQPDHGRADLRRSQGFAAVATQGRGAGETMEGDSSVPELQAALPHRGGGDDTGGLNMKISSSKANTFASSGGPLMGSGSLRSPGEGPGERRPPALMPPVNSCDPCCLSDVPNMRASSGKRTSRRSSLMAGSMQDGGRRQSPSGHSKRFARCTQCHMCVEVNRLRVHQLSCNFVTCAKCGETVLRRNVELCPVRLMEDTTEMLRQSKMRGVEQSSSLLESLSMQDVRGLSGTLTLNCTEKNGGARQRVSNMLEAKTEVLNACLPRHKPQLVMAPALLRDGLIPALAWLQRMWRSRLIFLRYEQCIFHFVWKNIDDTREQQVALLRRDDAVWRDRVRNPICLSTTSSQVSNSTYADDVDRDLELLGDSASDSASSTGESGSNSSSDTVGETDATHGPPRARELVAAEPAPPGVGAPAEGSGAPDGSLQHQKDLYTKEWIGPFLDGLTHDGTINLRTARRIIKDATALLSSRPIVQHVRSPREGEVFVVGDLHGQMKDFKYILSLMKTMPSERLFVIFNGDFVDRGKKSCEVLLSIFALLLTYPSYVYLNRGNHEDLKTNIEYGFQAELVGKYGRKPAKRLLHSIVASYESMPLVVVLDKKVMIVHGGIPREPVPLSKINELRRVRHVPSDEQKTDEERLLVDLLWSDPVEQYRSRQLGNRHQGQYWRTSKRGCGVEYLAHVTHEFLRVNKLNLVVRSHEVVQGGYAFLHGNRCCTVFSASDYSGVSRNRGAVAVFSNRSSRPIFYSWFLREDPAFMLTDFAGDININQLLHLDHLVEDEDGGTLGEANIEGTCDVADLEIEAELISNTHSELMGHDKLDGQLQVSGTAAPGDDGEAPTLPQTASALVGFAPHLLGGLNALRAVQEIMYNNRSALLSSFVNVDSTHIGLITEAEWADVLQVRLGLELPWLFMRTFLVPLTRYRGVPCVPYALFLRCVDSVCANQLQEEWKEYVFQKVFDTLDLPDDLLPDDEELQGVSLAMSLSVFSHETPTETWQLDGSAWGNYSTSFPASSMQITLPCNAAKVAQQSPLCRSREPSVLSPQPTVSVTSPQSTKSPGSLPENTGGRSFGRLSDASHVMDSSGVEPQSTGAAQTLSAPRATRARQSSGIWLNPGGAIGTNGTSAGDSAVTGQRVSIRDEPLYPAGSGFGGSTLRPNEVVHRISRPGTPQTQPQQAGISIEIPQAAPSTGIIGGGAAARGSLESPKPGFILPWTTVLGYSSTSATVEAASGWNGPDTAAAGVGGMPGTVSPFPTPTPTTMRGSGEGESTHARDGSYASSVRGFSLGRVGGSVAGSVAMGASNSEEPWRGILYNYNQLMQKLISLSPEVAKMSPNEFYVFFQMLDESMSGHVSVGDLVDLVHRRLDNDDGEGDVVVIDSDDFLSINILAPPSAKGAERGGTQRGSEWNIPTLNSQALSSPAQQPASSVTAFAKDEVRQDTVVSLARGDANDAQILGPPRTSDAKHRTPLAPATMVGGAQTAAGLQPTTAVGPGNGDGKDDGGDDDGGKKPPPPRGLMRKALPKISSPSSWAKDESSGSDTEGELDGTDAAGTDRGASTSPSPRAPEKESSSDSDGGRGLRRTTTNTTIRKRAASTSSSSSSSFSSSSSSSSESAGTGPTSARCISKSGTSPISRSGSSSRGMASLGALARSFGNLKALREQAAEAESAASAADARRKGSEEGVDWDGFRTGTQKVSAAVSKARSVGEDGSDGESSSSCSSTERNTEARWMYPATMLLQDFFLFAPPHSLQMTFAAMDRNRDGLLEFADFAPVFRYVNKKMVRPLSKKECERLFSRICAEAVAGNAQLGSLVKSNSYCCSASALNSLASPLSTSSSAKIMRRGSTSSADLERLGAASKTKSPRRRVEGRDALRRLGNAETPKWPGSSAPAMSDTPTADRFQSTRVPDRVAIGDLRITLKQFVDYFSVISIPVSRLARWDRRANSLNHRLSQVIANRSLAQSRQSAIDSWVPLTSAASTVIMPSTGSVFNECVAGTCSTRGFPDVSGARSWNLTSFTIECPSTRSVGSQRQLKAPAPLPDIQGSFPPEQPLAQSQKVPLKTQPQSTSPTTGAALPKAEWSGDAAHPSRPPPVLTSRNLHLHTLPSPEGSPPSTSAGNLSVTAGVARVSSQGCCGLNEEALATASVPCVPSARTDRGQVAEGLPPSSRGSRGDSRKATAPPSAARSRGAKLSPRVSDAARGAVPLPLSPHPPGSARVPDGHLYNPGRTRSPRVSAVPCDVMTGCGPSVGDGLLGTLEARTESSSPPVGGRLPHATPSSLFQCPEKKGREEPSLQTLPHSDQVESILRQDVGLDAESRPRRFTSPFFGESQHTNAAERLMMSSAVPRETQAIPSTNTRENEMRLPTAGEGDSPSALAAGALLKSFCAEEGASSSSTGAGTPKRGYLPLQSVDSEPNQELPLAAAVKPAILLPWQLLGGWAKDQLDKGSPRQAEEKSYTLGKMEKGKPPVQEVAATHSPHSPSSASYSKDRRSVAPVRSGWRSAVGSEATAKNRRSGSCSTVTAAHASELTGLSSPVVGAPHSDLTTLPPLLNPSASLPLSIRPDVRAILKAPTEKQHARIIGPTRGKRADAAGSAPVSILSMGVQRGALPIRELPVGRNNKSRYRFEDLPRRARVVTSSASRATRLAISGWAPGGLGAPLITRALSGNVTANDSATGAARLKQVSSGRPESVPAGGAKEGHTSGKSHPDPPRPMYTLSRSSSRATVATTAERSAGRDKAREKDPRSDLAPSERRGRERGTPTGRRKSSAVAAAKREGKSGMQ